jgi:hypothetical protein
MKPTSEQMAARARRVRQIKLIQLFIAVSGVSIFVGFWLARNYLAALIATGIYGVALIVVGSLVMMVSGGVGAIRWWRESLARR